jgi:hypothetical protein
MPKAVGRPHLASSIEIPGEVQCPGAYSRPRPTIKSWGDSSHLSTLGRRMWRGAASQTQTTAMVALRIEPRNGVR